MVKNGIYLLGFMSALLTATSAFAASRLSRVRTLSTDAMMAATAAPAILLNLKEDHLAKSIATSLESERG